MNRCRVTVKWVELGWVEMHCRRPDGHVGPHHDGLWWFDDLGYRVPRAAPRWYGQVTA